VSSDGGTLREKENCYEFIRAFVENDKKTRTPESLAEIHLDLHQCRWEGKALSLDSPLRGRRGFPDVTHLSDSKYSKGKGALQKKEKKKIKKKKKGTLEAIENRTKGVSASKGGAHRESAVGKGL